MLGILVIIVGVMMVTSEEVVGKTFTVDDNGNGDYGNIQDAINSSEDGDTILVWEGIYYENVVVNKTVSLLGIGSEETIIDGRGEGDVVTITSDWINMSNFRIIGSGKWESGIKVQGDHCIVSQNTCNANSIGIYIEDSNNSVVSENDCTASITGIKLESSDNAIITGNTCSYNERGIMVHRSNQTVISDNYFSAIGPLYAIHVWVSHDCIVSNNDCYNSTTGLYVQASNRIWVHNNTITWCQIGIKLYYSHESYLDKNNCFKNRISGMEIKRSNNNSITNNTIAYNNLGISHSGESMGNTAHYNAIFGNSYMGIRNTGEDEEQVYDFNVTHNFWGHASGPHHTSLNPNGEGDNLATNVAYVPCLDERGNVVYHPEKPDEDESYGSFVLFVLIFILIILLALLSTVIIFLLRDQKPRDGL